MLGFGKSRGPRFTPFAEKQPRLFSTLLCDGVTVDGVKDFAAFLQVHSQLVEEHPDHHLLMTFDDPGQAAYTSGHTIDAHGLDDVAGHDTSGLPPEVFEDGEHQGYLTTQAEFPIRLANMRKCGAKTSFADACEVLYWGHPPEANDPVAIMRDPDAVTLFKHEPLTICQFVPVQTGYDALAAFPNGYFHADLRPGQSYAVCRHLEEKFGTRLFAVGARCFGFRSDQPLSAQQANEAASDIASLYLEVPEGGVARLAEELAGKDWLILRYGES